MKHKQLALVLLAFLIAASSIVFLDNSAAIAAFCGSFLLVVGAYTALDLMAIVKGTGTLPSGKYVVADKWKYLFCMGLILLLLGICMVKQYFYELNLDLAYSMLGPGAIGIIGFVVAGMKMNKAATMSDGPEPSSEAVGTTDV